MIKLNGRLVNNIFEIIQNYLQTEHRLQYTDLAGLMA